MADTTTAAQLSRDEVNRAAPAVSAADPAVSATNTSSNKCEAMQCAVAGNMQLSVQISTITSAYQTSLTK